MEAVPLTPLETWIAGKVGGGEGGGQVAGRRAGGGGEAGGTTRPLDLAALRSYQLAKLNETLARVQERSRFYRRSLGGAAVRLGSLEDLAELPFTTADDLRAAPLDFLCVRQDEVERIVTLATSGTTGPPKRVFFTARDQELTRDFFHRGMSTLVGPGDRVLILLPGSLPGSVGDLLKDGLARMDVEGIPHGSVSDPRHTLEVIDRERVTALVGIPVQVLSLVRQAQADGRPHPRGLKSVLLSTDRMPAAVVRIIEGAWGCTVFDHYGTTEMGLGGGVDCRDRSGYHLREADLYFEIVDPVTGRPAPEGSSGEVVFSTLTREAMPLIRYRTGDVSRFVPGPCPCGTVLRRMAHVDERLAGRVALPGGETLGQGDFDEALFPIDGLTDFRVLLTCDPEHATIVVRVRSCGAPPPDTDAVLRALRRIPALGAEMARGRTSVEVVDWAEGHQVSPGTAKRKILCGEEASG